MLLQTVLSAYLPFFGQIYCNDGKLTQTLISTLQKLNIGTTSSVANPSKVALARQTLTCSEQDMQAFMADSFVLGKIPECPPPLDLC